VRCFFREPVDHLERGEFRLPACSHDRTLDGIAISRIDQDLPASPDERLCNSWSQLNDFGRADHHPSQGPALKFLGSRPRGKEVDF
jgi:hypothetical protein